MRSPTVFPVTSPQRIVGGPEWAGNQNKLYDIEGKIPDEMFVQMQNMTDVAKRGEISTMMRSLLADRFKLKVHSESRESKIYELVVAKGTPPKLPPPIDSTPSSATPESGSTPRSTQCVEGVLTQGIVVRSCTLDEMFQAPLFGHEGRPIVNKTGLSGKYSLTLHWLPDLPANPDLPADAAAGQPSAPEGQAAIFTALREQLGLSLVLTTGSVDVIVIDSIQLPSAN